MKHISLQTRRLRKANGWSQQELAKRAGLSRPTISALEDPNSTTMPSMRTLNAVATAFGVDASTLLTKVALPSHVRFRALTNFKSRDQVLAEAMKAYENYRTLEKATDKNLKGRFTLDAVRQHVDSHQGIERAKAAAKFIRQQCLELPNTSALPRIVEVIEQFGVRIISIPYHNDAFGLSFLSGEGYPVIAINTSDKITIERRIFSAAHELGHLILHNHFEGNAEGMEDECEEQEANHFAAELLMPQGGFEKIKEMYESSPLLEQVLEIKRRFVVSYQAVIFRLSTNKEDYKQLLRRFHAQYELKFGTPLSGIEEAQHPAGWHHYDWRLVPASQTTQEPENAGAGSPRTAIYFPQGRALQLLFDAIVKGRLDVEEVAKVLYTTNESARKYMERVRIALDTID